MNRSYFDILSFIITSIGTVLGAIGIFLALHSSTPISQLITWITGFLLCATIISASMMLIFLKMYVKFGRYTKAYENFNAAFARSHKLRENEQAINRLDVAIKELQGFCTHISEAFSQITGTQCGVCIKLFNITETKDICAVTFCRDTRSMEGKVRIKPDEDERFHYLAENTDFKYIFDNILQTGDEYKYYFSNSLCFEDFYRNTRIDDRVYPPRTKVFVYKEIKRYFKWPLPYKSGITVPITPLTDKKIDSNEIVGYLCIDSPNLWAFDSKYDITILRGVADGLYSTMKVISDVHFESVHKTVTHMPHKPIKTK